MKENNSNLKGLLEKSIHLNQSILQEIGKRNNLYSEEFAFEEENEIEELKVVAVRKDPSNQDILAFKLNDGKVYDYATMIEIVGRGLIKDLILGGARDGSITIKGVADGDPSNNLQNLQTF